MSEIKYFTPEGLQKLKDELDDLILRERPRIVQAIQEARDKGDLSENAEYDAAKEAQGLLEAKIAELQDLIFNARILDESKMDNSKVLLYSTVKIKNVKSGMMMTYAIVPEKEANFKPSSFFDSGTLMDTPALRPLLMFMQSSSLRKPFL